MGDRITLAEVARLAVILRRDPSSAVAAALEGWDYPISREALAILDLYDLTMAANNDSKKGRPKPHGGRPWPLDNKQERRWGNTGGRSREEVVAILNALGHSLPV
ncbi:hypothetical protein [Nocardioides sp. URHA0032]|uniref:hypothetical protein n=1 Tax=Nocardioides sp. URHA0032 TaxID=1380388 RepID=UPI000685654F|nr:hypothetical protein [Nocardioides sp. URHA0032]